MRRKRKITDDEKELFQSLKTLKDSGWGVDSISIDKTIISANYCPCCQKSLEYQGWSVNYEYRAFGICPNCEYAKLFWVEESLIAQFKKKVCRQIKEAA